MTAVKRLKGTRDQPLSYDGIMLIGCFSIERGHPALTKSDVGIHPVLLSCADVLHRCSPISSQFTLKVTADVHMYESLN